MCSSLTLTLRAAELLLANHAAAKAISSAQLHTGTGSGCAADRAALAASVAAAQRKHLKEQTLRWQHRGYCPDCGEPLPNDSFASHCIYLNDERNTQKRASWGFNATFSTRSFPTSFPPFLAFYSTACCLDRELLVHRVGSEVREHDHYFL